MKRMVLLMLVVTVATMCTMSTWAEYSVSLSAAFFTSATTDTSPTTENVTQKGYYQAYIISYAGDDVVNYIGNSMVKTIADASVVHYDYTHSWNGYINPQYCLYRYAADNYEGIDINPYTAYMIVYYNGDAQMPSEFLVIANAENAKEMNRLGFDDWYCTNSSWKTYAPQPDPVPEPTSGLLLLIGVAGLALKRKRA